MLACDLDSPGESFMKDDFMIMLTLQPVRASVFQLVEAGGAQTVLEDDRWNSPRGSPPLGSRISGGRALAGWRTRWGGVGLTNIEQEAEIRVRPRRPAQSGCGCSPGKQRLLCQLR